ncbi:MAG: UDP-N-acetylmuramoyl-tripeptide--D-alanyl-D-alanine ligase [Synergistaceae bacterium]|nr:UDP-N-acetylmuramoyl-tripeptide--D-alanyl-D-alanine ligase [Synergistaceae bacterium]
MPLDTEILILEFGANKPGEIRELTDYFPPTLAVLTAIEPVHLEGFKTLSGVLREKLEITNSPLIESIVYNNDNALLSEHFKYVVKSMGVGEWKDSDFVISLDNSEYNLPAMSFVLAHRPTQEVARFTANVWGRHNVMPLALAASVGHELGIRLQDSSDALKDFEALSGRGRIIFPEENKFIVDDAYNANPASMKASLETFSRVQTSGKIAVLGDMLELGEDKIYFHKELEPLLDGLDKVILVGSLWREALQDNERYIFVPDWQGGLNELRNLMNNLDWHGILIKASQSVGLSNIVKEITA